jgi:hypothetical protein
LGVKNSADFSSASSTNPYRLIQGNIPWFSETRSTLRLDRDVTGNDRARDAPEGQAGDERCFSFPAPGNKTAAN